MQGWRWGSSAAASGSGATLCASVPAELVCCPLLSLASPWPSNAEASEPLWSVCGIQEDPQIREPRSLLSSVGKLRLRGRVTCTSSQACDHSCFCPHDPGPRRPASCRPLSRSPGSCAPVGGGCGFLHQPSRVLRLSCLRDHGPGFRRAGAVAVAAVQSASPLLLGPPGVSGSRRWGAGLGLGVHALGPPTDRSRCTLPHLPWACPACSPSSAAGEGQTDARPPSSHLVGADSPASLSALQPHWASGGRVHVGVGARGVR